MSGTTESVVRMANQIARNFAVHGEETAIAETANHIELFWDPRMKAKAIEQLADVGTKLSPTAQAALRLVCGCAESSTEGS